jgi:hypothetical protein
MGRIYRRKRRSCSLCKPNKTGHMPRWTDKELDKIQRMEKEAKDAKSYKTE